MADRSPASQNRRLERAILLELLGGEGEQRFSSAELAVTLSAEANACEAALGQLAAVGLVCVDGSDAWASAAARHIDQLGLIGV